MPANNDIRSSHIPTLDGWRAIAVLLVLAGHLYELAGGSAYPSLGNHGVSIFFGISGLLITSRMLVEFEKTGRISLRAFYARRAFRILPASFAALAAIALAGAYRPDAVHLRDWLAALFWYRNYIPDSAGWLTLHYWSLAVEEHFYLFWPAALILLGVRSKRAIWASCVAIGVLWAWRWLNWQGNLHLFEAERFHRTDMRLDAILLGCLAALLWVPLARRIEKAPWFAVLGLVAVVLLASHRLQSPAFASSAYACLVPLLLAKSITGYEGSRILRVLEWKPVRWVGNISYSLYLFQGLWTGNGHVVLMPRHFWPLSLALTFLCAAASYYWLEQPAIAWGRQLVKSWSLNPVRRAEAVARES